MFRIFKDIIKRFDDLLFGSRIQSILKQKYFSKNLKFLQSNNNHLATIFFSKDLTNPLSELCDKYGSDKGSNIDLQGKIYKNPAHNYTDFYRLIFNQIRNSKLNILECGLGSNDENIPSNILRLSFTPR